MKPIVFILDFDNTMIGNIQPQLDEYCMTLEINTRLKQSKHKPFKYRRDILELELERYIIRPYLKQFLNQIKESYTNIEFFVYTASTHLWAKYIIPIVEKVIKFRFNRPLFTRLHLKNDIKSIEHIKPRIFRSLKRKYNLKNIKDINNVLLIDNRSNILKEKELLVNCPSFNNIYPINYVRHIPLPIIQRYYPIVEAYLSIPHSITYEEFIKRYNTVLSNKNELIKRNNNNDEYWKNMYKHIKKYVRELKRNNAITPYNNKVMANILNTVKN